MHRLALLCAIVIALVAAGAGGAHNAGYVITGNGSCQEVGSGKEAPPVPEQNPNRNAQGQLDLIPGSGDQFGARFAADQGQSAVQRPFSAAQTCPPA